MFRSVVRSLVLRHTFYSKTFRNHPHGDFRSFLFFPSPKKLCGVKKNL